MPAVRAVADAAPFAAAFAPESAIRFEKFAICRLNLFRIPIFFHIFAHPQSAGVGLQ